MDKVIVDCEVGTATTVALTPDEVAEHEAGQTAAVDQQWAQLRTDRDARLAACDWTQITDTELTAADVEAWAAYRQALRDLPEHTTDPANPDWPEPPATPAEKAA